MRKFAIIISGETYEHLRQMAMGERRNYREQAGWLVEQAVTNWLQQGHPPTEVDATAA